MARITILQNTFGSGEISPKTEGLVNHPVYQNGCRFMENLIPRRIGGFRRMPGSYHIGFSYADTAKARLIRYKGKQGLYACELTDTRIRFWKLDHTLVEDGGSPFVLTSPYSESELFQIQFKCIKGKLWLVHGNHAPRYVEESGYLFDLITPTFTGARTFDSTDNYPSIIDYIKGRLLLGATNAEPNLQALSRSPIAATGEDRFTDFTIGTNPDDAIILLESEERFHWTIAQKTVLAGGVKNTWMSDGSIPTPATFDLNEVGYVGTAPIQPAKLGTAVFYIGAPEPTLHMMLFSAESGGYVDVDLSKYHDHILKPGVVEMTAMLSPEPILWIVRSDGQLVSCTVEVSGSQLSYGLVRQKPADGGLVESAAVMETGTGNELWESVKRGTKRSIEYSVVPADDDDFEEIHYVDSGLRFEYGTPTNTITGLDHLEGKEVDAIGDGSSMPRKTVSGGQVVYEKTVTKIHIGLPNQSKLITPRPEIPLNYTWQGKQKKVDQVIARIHRTIGGKIGPDEDHLQPIKYLRMGAGAQKYGEPPVPFTGDKTVDFTGTIEPDGSVVIVQDEPFPLTVLALITTIEIVEV